MSSAIIIPAEVEISEAKKEISSAWRSCKKTERYGMKFGEICYRWQQRLSAQGQKGKGLHAILQEVSVPERTAYWWIERYKESKGLIAKRIVSSESMEWYTPPKYLEAAREVMDGIDLDPASCEVANEQVQAKTFYSIEDDGLSKDWFGKIWLNPPYGESGPVFIGRLIEEWNMQRIEAAIVLVNGNSYDSSWFQPFWDHVLCFTDHRIDFYREKERESSSTHGSAFVYFGLERDKFNEVFAQFGAVVGRYGQFA